MTRLEIWIVGALASFALLAAVVAVILGLRAELKDTKAALANMTTIAAQASAQSNVTTSAATAADHAATTGAATTSRGEEAARHVQAASGASVALAPDVLSRWRAGIDGVRASPVAVSGADRARGGEPSGAVPSPRP